MGSDPEARLRVRGAAGRIIERIDCLIVADKPGAQKRFAAVQVTFRDRPVTRSYLVLHENSKHGPRGTEIPPRWSVRTFVSAGLPPIDLRKPADAAKVEKLLSRLDIRA